MYVDLYLLFGFREGFSIIVPSECMHVCGQSVVTCIHLRYIGTINVFEVYADFLLFLSFWQA